jgi:two-component system sensor histidine kinase PilS (NtrC family)
VVKFFTRESHADPEQKPMSQVQDFDAYPLTAPLTKRVLTYLSLFRLFIGVALPVAYLSDSLVQAQNIDNSTLAATALISYFVLAAYLFIETRYKATNVYYLAQISLFIDILFLALLLFIFGGLESGLGVLLVFVCATAAILLPLRTAFFLAALASLAVIGESFLGGYLRSGEAENLIRSGIYGFTNFLIAVLAHVLAYWARDYRLIAERHQATLSRLEQINELIIRRMRSGVLAVDRNGVIQMMNESAWFHLGSPPALERDLPDVSPELYEAMNGWRNRTSTEPVSITLQASQTEVVPKFVALPGESNIRTLIFLEDNDAFRQHRS